MERELGVAHERKEAAPGLPPTNCGLGPVHSFKPRLFQQYTGDKIPSWEGGGGSRVENQSLRELMRNLPPLTLNVLNSEGKNILKMTCRVSLRYPV